MEHVDCDVRAEFSDVRGIFRRLWNVEPIAIHNVAGCRDSPKNIIRSHSRPEGLGADPGEYFYLRICLSGLRGCLLHEVCITLSIALKPLRLNIEDVGIARSVGGELGVAEKTIKVHRGRLMQKLGITSVAELVHMVQKAEVPPPVRSETKV